MPAPLHGIPEQRDRVLMRALIGSAERFFRYLLALLADQEAPEDLPALPGDRGDGNSTAGVGPASLPVLEKLVQTMRREPAKLLALHPLVSDLAADDALPAGFADLWEAIFDAAIVGDRQ
jgi:hypothetical protein